jgi:hypothetical protein
LRMPSTSRKELLRKLTNISEPIRPAILRVCARRGRRL